MNYTIYNNRQGFTGVPHPYWIASTSETDYPPLLDDLRIDVAIIGGGITGITTAYLLKKEGLKVAVIEADRIVQGTSGHTTAKITSQHGLIYNKIKTHMGEEKARQYADANETAIRTIEKIITENNIDCDFCHRSAYTYTNSDKYIEKIQKEAETAKELGIDASYLEKIPLPFEVKAAVRFDNQAQFHPRKYLLSLAEKISGEGSYIFEKTRIIDVEEGNPNTLKTSNGHNILASKVVIASHFPCYDGLGLYFTRIYPERSYALGIKIKESFPEGMFISAESPTRSLRSQKFEDGDLIILSGDHHKTGHDGSTEKHYENLKEFAEKIYTVEDILYRWSTQDCMTVDGVPYVGYLTTRSNDIYVATGFQKWGMTNSAASAMIIRDLIVKGENPWVDVYNPSRFTPVTSAKEFVKENSDVAKNFFKDKLEALPNDVDIEPGEGKIINVEGKRMGAYKDENGKVHVVDTTCTHLGCELHWNNAEKTWDCPCHGSRFTYEGDIVEGPALNPLSHSISKPNDVNPDIL